MTDTERFFEECANIEYEKDVDLSLRSSFRIGGKAKYGVWPKSESAFCAVIDYLTEEKIKFTVLGNGTNVLFSDEGYDGVVVFTTSLKKIRCSRNTIYAEAGASFTNLAAFARNSGLSGLEFAYGIPGTVGGAVYMNAGAYDGEVSKILQKSAYFDPVLSKRGELYNRSHEFGYRESAYMKNGCVILSASFELVPGDVDEINTKMEGFLAARREKQPLEYPSAGSAFKRYPGYFTAKLIDEAGLKGLTVGGAQVSLKHAGFIINKGGATSSDVKTLIKRIQDVIFEKNGIRIEREVRYID